MEVSECLLSLKLKQLVDEIAEVLSNSVSTVIVDYRGLTVAEVTDLRSQLREAGVEYKVYKNTMVRRAAEKAGIEGLDEFLTGPTAIATSSEDAVAAAKVISGFAKDHEALEIKSGVMEGNVITAEEVKTVGSLPSHDGLVSMLLSVLQAPVRNFAYAVKAIGEQKKKTLNNFSVKIKNNGGIIKWLIMNKSLKRLKKCQY